MSLLSKNWRKLSLAMVLAPLMMQTAQAQLLAVKWNTAINPGVQCIRISIYNQPLKKPYVRAYGVTPTNGSLSTNIKVGKTDGVEVRLYKINQCFENPNEKHTTRGFSLNMPSNVVYFAKKYVYVFV